MRTSIKWMLFLTGMIAALGCGGCGSDSSPQLVGWAVGTRPDRKKPAVMKTVDGITWRNISSATFRGFEGRNVSAIDSQCAWISLNGENENTPGQVLRTLDGGATWQDVSPVWPSASINNYVQIKALSRDMAWVATVNFLASTRDGGRTWTPVVPNGFNTGETYSYSYLEALDDKHAWAIGSIQFADKTFATLLARTEDGDTWETMPSLPGEKYLLGLSITPPQTVRVTTNSTASLYTSYDGGATFPVRGYPLGNPTGNDLNNVAVYGKYVWTVMDRAVFSVASDGGYQFTNIKLPSFGDRGYSNLFALAISALDEKRIWVGGSADAGSPGGLLWTNDGGQSWHEPVPTLYGYEFWRISFVGGVK